MPWVLCQAQLRDGDQRPPPRPTATSDREARLGSAPTIPKALWVPRDGVVTPPRRQDPRRARRWATAAAGVRDGAAGCSLRAGGSAEPAYNLNLVSRDPNPEEESLHA